MTDRTSKEARTSALLRKLFRTHDIEQFMERNAGEMSVTPFHEHITGLCRTLGLVPEQIIRQAGIERTYGHQLFNGTRKPSREKVIQLAFGFRMDVEGTQELLQIAQKSLLYPKIKRDAAILFCISHRKDFLETQSVLHSLGLPLLGGEA